jgi:hypothetical protein
MQHRFSLQRQRLQFGAQLFGRHAELAGAFLQGAALAFEFVVVGLAGGRTVHGHGAGRVASSWRSSSATLQAWAMQPRGV